MIGILAIPAACVAFLGAIVGVVWLVGRLWPAREAP